MSDERIGEAGEFDSLPDARTDPTARLLSDVLARAADDVQPAPDGLARIRAAIEADRGRAPLRGLAGGLTGRSARPGRSRARRSWLPALAAAASVVLLAGVAGFALQRFPLFAADEPTPPSGQNVGPTPPQLPVYRVGRLEGEDTVEYGLFREYRTTRATTLDDRLSEALTEAVTQRPDDADYERVFGTGTGQVDARWDVAAGQVVVTLTPAMTTVRNASDDRARIAVQQIVWTATAVLAQVRAGSADVPVRIEVGGSAVDRTMFGRPAYTLGGLFFRSHGVDDPSAPVWLVDPHDGDSLGKQVSSIGISAGYTARGGVPWTLERNGKVVDQGVAKVGFLNGTPVPGSRGTAEIMVDHTERGDYVLTVSEPDSAGEPLWTDSKTFVVN